MKNVRKDQLKKCIFLTVDEFREEVRAFFGDDTLVEVDLEGVIIVEADEGALYTEEVLAGLAKHFGVAEVTSVHTDGYKEMGVWIVYKEEEMVSYEYLLKKSYGRYKWDWCKQRGFDLKEVEEANKNDEEYQGQMFVCLQEFEDNEYQDRDYMRYLLCDEEFAWWEIRDKLEKIKSEIDVNRIAVALDMTYHQASEVVRIFDELKRQYDEGNLAYCFIRSPLETTNDYITEWEDHWHREESVEAFWEDEKDNYRSDYEDLSVLETLEAFLDHWKNNFYEVLGEKMIFVVM